MADPSTWLCWQLADSAFPAGGFAHSLGVEAAWAHGRITGPDQLADATAVILTQQAASALPLIKATHQQPASFHEIDHLCHASQTNHIARNASLAQGRALLRAAIEAFPNPDLHERDESLRNQKSPGHLPPIFGVITASLGIKLDTAADLYLFQSLRSLMSAAVRLGIVGPLQAQNLTHQLTPKAQHAAAHGLSLSLDDIAETAPALSLMQTNQDRIYSRLFQS